MRLKTMIFWCLPALALSAPLWAGPGLHLLKKIPLPGDTGWDYLNLDAKSRRLYVTRGDRVQVLDVDGDTLLGEVAPLQGIHGVALVPDLNRGYVSEGKADEVSCFELSDFKVIAKVPVQSRPDAIVMDAQTLRVVAMNGESGSATVIEAGDNAALASIDLGGSPEYAAADGKGLVFVNLEDKSELVRLDLRKLKVTGRFSVAPGASPSSLSLDKAHHRLFIGCRNQLMVVMDSESGGVLASLSIGAGVDASAYDPATGLIYHSCGDGTLSVIHQDDADHYSLVENVATQKGSRTMALDLKTHHLFLASALFEPLPTPEPGHPSAEHHRAPMVPGSFAILEFGKD
jgi:DNA-binding beta-propeller fold protein YncE